MHQVLPPSRSVRFLISALCASAAAPAGAQVLMLQPASASTNMGNFGTYEPFRAIDQSGLSAPYTSGVTELAPFAAATHTVSGGSSFTTWFSQISTTGNYDMALGGSFLISAIVIWIITRK